MSIPVCARSFCVYMCVCAIPDDDTRPLEKTNDHKVAYRQAIGIKAYSFSLHKELRHNYFFITQGNSFCPFGNPRRSRTTQHAHKQGLSQNDMHHA
jgi:hypothetical protein